jgi:hypothetical protein
MRAVIVLALCLLLSGCFLSVPEPSLESIPETEAFASYRAQVAACLPDIHALAVVLSNMGNYHHYTWSALPEGEDADFSDLMGKTYKWLADNAEETPESVVRKYEGIKAKTEAILPLEAPGFETVSGLFRELIQSLDTFFSLITVPSGTLSDYAKAFNGLTADIVEKHGLLTRYTATEGEGPEE